MNKSALASISWGLMGWLLFFAAEFRLHRETRAYLKTSIEFSNALFQASAALDSQKRTIDGLKFERNVFLQRWQEILKQIEAAQKLDGVDIVTGDIPFEVRAVQHKGFEDYCVVADGLERQIARDFDKQIVIILAWNHEHKLLHTVTYGAQPGDKISAAKGGEIATKALGMDVSKSGFNEDFRTVDAAKNAQLRDLADRTIHTLRSYQFGNSAPDPAKDLADEIEALLKKPQ